MKIYKNASPYVRRACQLRDFKAKNYKENIDNLMAFRMNEINRAVFEEKQKQINARIFEEATPC